MKFTQTSVNAYKLPATAGNDFTIWDDGMPGFGIRFRDRKPGGSWIIQTKKLNGKTLKIGLGRVSQVTL
jgi:hypothetical protein